MINNVRERNPMPEQDRAVRLTNFNEVALGYTEADAIREAMRCLKCRKKPCTVGCPINQQIPEFIARVAEGDFEGAYEIITVRSCMPSICGRVCPQEQQCEKNCAQGVRGEAVGIGRLERFVADWHAARTAVSAPQVEKKGKKVAVIGSGPAGIACAGDLASLGYDVTVFEKLSYAGGILTYGIPQFVLPNSVVDREIETLKARGVEIVTSAPIDKNKSIDALFAEGYEAVFVGNGADVPQTPRGLDTSLTGVWSANDYLTEVNLNTENLPENIKSAKRVLVVGGGMVGCEAAEYLAERGHEVAIIEMKDIIAADVTPENRRYMFENFETHHVLLRPSAKVSKFYPDGVDYSLLPSAETGSLRGYDSIVLAMGSRSNAALRETAEKLAPQVFVIGEAAKAPGNAVLATGDALNAALQI